MKESIVKALDCSPNNSRKRCLTQKRTRSHIKACTHYCCGSAQNNCLSLQGDSLSFHFHFSQGQLRASLFMCVYKLRKAWFA